MDDPIFKDGFYIYSNGMMIPESSAIEGLSTTQGSSEDWCGKFFQGVIKPPINEEK
jgi:hypothetical protein